MGGMQRRKIDQDGKQQRARSGQKQQLEGSSDPLDSSGYLSQQTAVLILPLYPKKIPHLYSKRAGEDQGELVLMGNIPESIALEPEENFVPTMWFALGHRLEITACETIQQPIVNETREQPT